MPVIAYDSLLEATPLALVIIGADERVVSANTLAKTLFDTAMVGRHYITALRQPDLLDAIERVIEGRAEHAETVFLATDAMRETTYRVEVARIRIETGAAVLVSFTDTTDLREAGQMRRDFVANVSHELRTPLTALLGFIETLRGAARDDPAARDRFLTIMGSEAGRMNRLVQDLLSLSRVESEERVRPQEQVDLAALAQSVASSLKDLAREADMEIELTGTDAPAIVPGDADQLSQILANLIENAIKYGRSGRRIGVDLVRDDHHPFVRGPAVTVTVSDDGEGFDPMHIPRLTERFYRVDDHRSRELGGTGLGLAIVKHIVNRHRGRLRIASAPGEGSRFSVILPAS